MAKRQIVIELDDEVYKRFMDDYVGCPDIIYAVRKGIPLPEHHGRIGDLDSIMNDISNSINEMTNIGISIDGQYLWAKLNDAIDNAPTIIEADKEE